MQIWARSFLFQTANYRIFLDKQPHQSLKEKKFEIDVVFTLIFKCGDVYAELASSACEITRNVKEK